MADIPGPARRLWTCPVHGKALTAFCPDCGIPMCPDCRQPKHVPIPLADCHLLDLPETLICHYLQHRETLIRPGQVLRVLEAKLKHGEVGQTKILDVEEEEDKHTLAELLDALQHSDIESVRNALGAFHCCVPRLRARRVLSQQHQGTSEALAELTSLGKDVLEAAIEQHYRRLRRLRKDITNERRLQLRRLAISRRLLKFLMTCKVSSPLSHSVVLAFGFLYPLISRDFGVLSAPCIDPGKFMYCGELGIVPGITRLTYCNDMYTLSHPDDGKPLLQISQSIPVFIPTHVDDGPLVWDVSSSGFLAYAPKGRIGTLQIIHLSHYETASLEGVRCNYLSFEGDNKLYIASNEKDTFKVWSVEIKELYEPSHTADILKETPVNICETRKKSSDCDIGKFHVIHKDNLYEYCLDGSFYPIAKNVDHLITIFNNCHPELKCVCVSKVGTKIHLLMNDNRSLVVENTVKHQGCEVGAVILPNSLSLKDAGCISSCGYICYKGTGSTTALRFDEMKTIGNEKAIYFDPVLRTWFFVKINVCE